VVEADAVIEELSDLVSLLGLERSGYSNRLRKPVNVFVAAGSHQTA
jgi:hypothetical protein